MTAPKPTPARESGGRVRLRAWTALAAILLGCTLLGFRYWNRIQAADSLETHAERMREADDSPRRRFAGFVAKLQGQPPRTIHEQYFDSARVLARGGDEGIRHLVAVAREPGWGRAFALQALFESGTRSPAARELAIELLESRLTMDQLYGLRILSNFPDLPAGAQAAIRTCLEKQEVLQAQDPVQIKYTVWPLLERMDPLPANAVDWLDRGAKEIRPAFFSAFFSARLLDRLEDRKSQMLPLIATHLKLGVDTARLTRRHLDWSRDTNATAALVRHALTNASSRALLERKRQRDWPEAVMLLGPAGREFIPELQAALQNPERLKDPDKIRAWIEAAGPLP